MFPPSSHEHRGVSNFTHEEGAPSGAASLGTPQVPLIALDLKPQPQPKAFRVSGFGFRVSGFGFRV